MKRLLPLAFFLLLAPPAGAQSSASVDVGPGNQLVYSPDPVTVSPGGKVTWTWRSGFHSVTFADGRESDAFEQGHTYTRTFPTAGTFAYHCINHPSMKGSVKVVAPAPTTSSPRPTTASPKPTSKSPTPTPTPSRTPSRTPTSVVTTASAAPTTAGPAPAVTTAVPSTSPPDTVSLDEPLPPDRTGPAIALGLLVGLGGLGTATLLYLRRRA